MRKIMAFEMALAVWSLALIGPHPHEAVAVPDRTVAIHLGGLREPVTTVSPGEEVTWINASGAPAVRVVFDGVSGAPENSGLFTSSVSRSFSHPGDYPYTAFVGARALPIRGMIVVR